MGFDLSGLDPVMREINEDAYSVFNEYNNMDWNERDKIFKTNKELADQYWEEYRKRDAENPGIYFRANVWWWRRIWQFTCIECEDILNEDDMAYGNTNDCHVITEGKAVLIAKRLQECVNNGKAQAFEDVIKEFQDNAKKDENGEFEEWDANYPFKVAFLQEFITFCSESGGFSIG